MRAVSQRASRHWTSLATMPQAQTSETAPKISERAVRTGLAGQAKFSEWKNPLRFDLWIECMAV